MSLVLDEYNKKQIKDENDDLQDHVLPLLYTDLDDHTQHILAHSKIHNKTALQHIKHHLWWVAIDNDLFHGNLDNFGDLLDCYIMEEYIKWKYAY